MSEERLIRPARRITACKYCGKEAVAMPMRRANGRVHIELRCARHGTLGDHERRLVWTDAPPVTQQQQRSS